MNARLLLLLLLPGAAGAQDLAAPAAVADGFAPVTPPARFDFPADHGPHPDFRLEWWYITFLLEDGAGRPMGAQWTLFRQALEPGPAREGWANQQVWNAHAAVTTEDRHLHAERFGRGGIGQAGVEAEPFRAWLDHWEMVSLAEGDADQLSDIEVTADAGDFAFTLRARAEGPLVFHGAAGYSVKSEAGQASYYYSQPFYRVDGEIVIEGERHAVTGTAWLDREWSTEPLLEGQEGWDWVALHLADGQRVMVAQMRQETGPFRAGTWIEADGRHRPLDPDEIEMTPLAHAEVDGRMVPVEWHVAVPTEGLAVDIAALNPQSWMGTTIPYWEGPVSLSGSHAGRGYLEMTGYE
jgi:predicted secreted hydrolase